MSLSVYFAACSTVAGSLIGLLFVAITLRYDQILGPAAPVRYRGMAKGAFIALADALAVSLLALLPRGGLGVAVIVVAAASIVSTARTHVGLGGRGAIGAPVFLLSATVYAVQAAIGVALVADPNSQDLVTVIAYLVLAVFAAALVRCWLLVLPGSDHVA